MCAEKRKKDKKEEGKICKTVKCLVTKFNTNFMAFFSPRATVYPDQFAFEELQRAAQYHKNCTKMAGTCLRIRDEQRGVKNYLADLNVFKSSGLDELHSKLK